MTGLIQTAGSGLLSAAAWAPRLLALLLSVLCFFQGRADEAPVGIKHESLRVGFIRNTFLNMNRNDVEAAFKVFTETVGRRRGYLITPQMRIFEDAADFEAAIKAGAIDLSIIDAWSYLGMDIQAQMGTYYVSVSDEGIGKRYLVLTSRSAGPTTLADLRGKSIVEYATANANMGHYWLETVLSTNQPGTHGTFFGEIETVGKPTAAVLPVFFRKKDSCLVDEAGFNIMKEMNPQVGRELQVIAASESLANSVLCLANSGWSSEQYKSDLIEALKDLHKEPAGQQILTLFKAVQLVPFQETQLETVTRLRTTHDRLLKEAKP